MNYVASGSNNAAGQYPVADSMGKIAIMAHDSKRDELVGLLRECGQSLRLRKLVATHVTGMVCSQRLNVEIELLQSSVHGGDLQLCAMVVDGGVDAVIFLRDPLYGGYAAEDVAALVRVCDLHQVPIATNAATAWAVLGQLACATDASVSQADGLLESGRVTDPKRI